MKPKKSIQERLDEWCDREEEAEKKKREKHPYRYFVQVLVFCWVLLTLIVLAQEYWWHYADERKNQEAAPNDAKIEGARS